MMPILLLQCCHCSPCAATVFWIPLRTYQYIVRHSTSSSSGPHTDAAPSPLSDLALSLLLVLAHYPAHHAQLHNAGREGLRSLQDVPGTADAEGGRGLVNPASSTNPTASFARLYDFFAHGACSSFSSVAAGMPAGMYICPGREYTHVDVGCTAMKRTAGLM